METKPMIRELTAEVRFESGIDALVAGKRYAFLAIVGDRYVARLGAAVADEPGYYPIPSIGRIPTACLRCKSTLMRSTPNSASALGLPGSLSPRRSRPGG
jgi:hypothetical protein